MSQAVKKENEINKNLILNRIKYSEIEYRGAAFMIVPFEHGHIFSREDFTEDQNMFYSAAEEFALKEIEPIYKEIDNFNKDLSLKLFKKMGELGFHGIDIPEEYGGLELDKTTACIVADVLSKGKTASMMVTFSAHTGIGMLPIIWYGNKIQKEKYLPKMASGEWMSCFALTESSAGSDAMGGTMSAILSDDGKHYILNGQKIYVTNGGWADVFTTFAKVDGKYTSFIVDKTCEGMVIGDEEKKMGIKGSSTVTLYFENCKVPVENVLGEVGQGGPIALNVLYTGRYKLGVTTASGAKNAIDAALNFANEREQFSRSITNFDMIKSKFARMITRTWESDNINYMTCGSIDRSIALLDKNADDYYILMQKVIEDHSVEASICKIVGSEALAYVVDECVQIMGGAGFIEEYGMATLYRDERINRIFEGTNEVNRLLISGMLLKKSILEELPIRDAISLRADDWYSQYTKSDSPLDKYIKVTEYMRSSSLFILNSLINIYGQDLKNNQWVIEPYSNMVCSLAIVDTGLKRIGKIDKNDNMSDFHELLKLSMCQQYNSFNKEMDTIINHIFSHNSRKETMDFVLSMQAELDYHPDEIKLMNEVVETLYRYGRYHMD